MSSRWINIGILQLRSHPALILGDHDLLTEPTWPASSTQLGGIARGCEPIEIAQREIRAKYISWAEHRLMRVLEAIGDMGALPDILVLPECSVPGEALPALRARAAPSKLVVCAGTHTPAGTPEMLAAYERAGVPKSLREQLSNGAPTVLPVISDDQTGLFPKAVPSIFERCDHHCEETSPVDVRTIELRVGGQDLRCAVFVCAEALRLPSYSEYPDLSVIVAMERQPARFEAHIAMLTNNGVPVVLANDAGTGGSGIGIVVDERAGGWWWQPPFNGRLPVGDCYLEMRVNLDAVNPQVGTVRPAKQFILQRVAPVLHENDSGFELDQQALIHAYQRDTTRLGAVVQSIAKDCDDAPLLIQRWRLLHSFAGKGRLADSLLDVVGQSLCIAGSPPLSDLESEFCGLMAQSLANVQTEQSALNLDDATFGRIAKLELELRTHAQQQDKRQAVASVVVDSRTALIGRESDKAKVRELTTQGGTAILAVTGLEGIGKTSIVTEGLAQTGCKVLRLRCVEATSADYLFEGLLRGVGRVPMGIAPRADFASRDVVDALSSVDVLWIEDAHHLVRQRAWRTSRLEAFFKRITDGLKQTGSRLLIESRRYVQLESDSGKRASRWVVRGLTPVDAEVFFVRELRRAKVPNGALTQEHKQELIRLVDGHPGMLALTAEAIGRDGVAAVLQELRNRKGWFLAAIENLVESLGLSDHEKRIIAALMECRRPIPREAFRAIEGVNVATVLRDLGDAALVSMSNGEVSLAPLLEEVVSVVGSLKTEQRVSFHRAASVAFCKKVETSLGIEAHTAAVEANYHAFQAGEQPPFDPAGLLDSLLGAARKRFAEDDYESVIRLLEAVRPPGSHAEIKTVREEVWELLARAYAWQNDYDSAFQVGSELARAAPDQAHVFLRIGDAAMRARRYDDVERALEKARTANVVSAERYLLEGRLVERKTKRYRRAADAYREVLRIDPKHGWTHFYLGRCLIQLGDLDDALDVLDSGLDINKVRQGRKARNLENALFHQQMVALTLKGDTEDALTLARFLENAEDVRPEVLVYAAYVRVVADADLVGSQDLSHFDEAIDRLRAANPTAAHSRAEVSLFRGKLLERLGRLVDAEREYAQACDEDPYNMHMRLCHARVLEALTESAGPHLEDFQKKLSRVQQAIVSLRS